MNTAAFIAVFLATCVIFNSFAMPPENSGEESSKLKPDKGFGSSPQAMQQMGFLAYVQYTDQKAAHDARKVAEAVSVDKEGTTGSAFTESMKATIQSTLIQQSEEEDAVESTAADATAAQKALADKTTAQNAPAEHAAFEEAVAQKAGEALQLARARTRARGAGIANIADDSSNVDENATKTVGIGDKSCRGVTIVAEYRANRDGKTETFAYSMEKHEIKHGYMVGTIPSFFGVQYEYYLGCWPFNVGEGTDDEAAVTKDAADVVAAEGAEKGPLVMAKKKRGETNGALSTVSFFFGKSQKTSDDNGPFTLSPELKAKLYQGGFDGLGYFERMPVVKVTIRPAKNP